MAKTEQVMRQSVLKGPRQSVVELRAIPRPKRSEVLVKVDLCGVCASELELWRNGSGEMVEGLGEPLLGHEIVGTVVALGEAVNTFSIGQRVTGLIFQAFAEFAVADAAKVAPVPEGIPDEAAMGEPLSCMMSALRRTRIELGDRVAIVGLGYMGLLFLMAMRLRGARQIVGVDFRPDSRDLARVLGADVVLAPEDVDGSLKLTKFNEIAQGNGFDVVIEASGHPDGLTLAAQMVKAHGFLSILGYHQGGFRSVDMQLWNWKAIEVLNAHERRIDYQMDSMKRGLDLIAAGRFDPSLLVTHRFNLDEVDLAFSALEKKPHRFVKGVIGILSSK